MSEEKQFNDPRNDLDFLLDHEDISEQDKKVAEDILNFINENQSKEIPLKLTISQIKHNFKLEEVPLMDIKSSLWYEFTKDEKLGASLQGYKQTEKDGKKIRIPYISFSADLDYLNEMITRFITRINNLKKETE